MLVPITKLQSRLPVCCHGDAPGADEGYRTVMELDPGLVWGDAYEGKLSEHFVDRRKTSSPA
jgi:hypothetical protein